MKIAATFLIGLMAANSMGVAAADLKAIVSEAAQKLSDQSSYQWKTAVRSEGGGPFGGNASTTGRVERDAYTRVSVTSPQTSLEFARKADKAAVLLDGNWMTPDQAAARLPAGGRGGGPFGGGGFNLNAVTDFKMPGMQVEEILSKASNLRQEGQTISADLSADAVNELMNAGNPFAGRGGRGGTGGARGGRGLGAPLRDAQGTVTFTIKDGLLTEYIVALTGTRELQDRQEKQSRTTTTAFADIGS